MKKRKKSKEIDSRSKIQAALMTFLKCFLPNKTVLKKILYVIFKHGKEKTN